MKRVTLFNVSENNIISIYKETDRERTILGIKNALVHTDDENMTDVMKKTIKKLSDVSDEDFENTEFFLTV